MKIANRISNTRQERIEELVCDMYDVQSATRIVKAEKAIRRQVVIDMVLNTDISTTKDSKNNTISIPMFRARLATYIPYPNVESLYESLVRYEIYNLKCQPYKKYINNGMFVYSPITTTVDGITADVPNWKITPKGQTYVSQILISMSMDGYSEIDYRTQELIDKFNNDD